MQGRGARVPECCHQPHVMATIVPRGVAHLPPLPLAPIAAAMAAPRWQATPWMILRVWWMQWAWAGAMLAMEAAVSVPWELPRGIALAAPTTTPCFRRSARRAPRRAPAPTPPVPHPQCILQRRWEEEEEEEGVPAAMQRRPMGRRRQRFLASAPQPAPWTLSQPHPCGAPCRPLLCPGSVRPAPLKTPACSTFARRAALARTTTPHMWCILVWRRLFWLVVGRRHQDGAYPAMHPWTGPQDRVLPAAHQVRLHPAVMLRLQHRPRDPRPPFPPGPGCVLRA